MADQINDMICKVCRNPTARKYCSLKCRGIGFHNDGTKILQCMNCKKNFNRQKSYPVGKIVTCNTKCYKGYKQKKRTEELNLIKKEGKKTCPICKQALPLSEFYTYVYKKIERLFSYCKSCYKEKHKVVALESYKRKKQKLLDLVSRIDQLEKTVKTITTYISAKMKDEIQKLT